MIDENKLLEEIKTRLTITQNYHDSLLLAYANDIKRYLLSGGVPHEVVESEEAVGVIAQGVSDLWHMGAGDGSLSDYFYQRAYQLRLEEVES